MSCQVLFQSSQISKSCKYFQKVSTFITPHTVYFESQCKPIRSEFQQKDKRTATDFVFQKETLSHGQFQIFMAVPMVSLWNILFLLWKHPLPGGSTSCKIPAKQTPSQPSFLTCIILLQRRQVSILDLHLPPCQCPTFPKPGTVQVTGCQPSSALKTKTPPGKLSSPLLASGKLFQHNMCPEAHRIPELGRA